MKKALLLVFLFVLFARQRSRRNRPGARPLTRNLLAAARARTR